MTRIVKMLVAITVVVGLSAIVCAERPFVVMKSGKKEFFDKVTADGVNLRVKKGSIARKIRKGDYKYARVPLPTLVRKAAKALGSKKYDSAVSLFKKAYDEYKLLGWDAFCVYGSARASVDMGKKKQAVDGLLRLKGKPEDPDKMLYYIKAKRLLAQLYVDDAQFDKAKVVLKELGACKNDAVAAFSNNLLGDILMKQGKRKDATLMYLRTALLFSEKNTKERPAALFKVIEILKQDRNNKYKDFEKILRKDYPMSKFTKSL
ncbi:MAG: tetratricopeptide repeat protein [Kiritimatiellaeota bacterium]|nr:tetratricopeptide repeat protein [Kiritimatiellota bacterium]